MNCRFCENKLENVFIDLGNAPASNSFLSEAQLNEPEVFFPLRVLVCDKCFLVQVDEYKKFDAIFNSDYVYFSSYSTSWLAHAKKYADMVEERFGLDSNSQVIEIASNDGYLLQYFVEKEIPVLGIEPSSNTAAVAAEKGVASITEFFGVSLAEKLRAEGKQADLLLGNNVLAHVPDIVDFVTGMKIALAGTGVITVEFPHLVQLIGNNQFDTIYHEHFSYLSLFTVRQIFESQGLTVFDVEELETHGGSLRVFARHAEDDTYPILDSVAAMLEKELKNGIDDMAYYQGFQPRAMTIKREVLGFLLEQKALGKTVAAYGAAAKGNTLLNYCGVKSDLIDFVADANPAKQEKFLPGSHIPVVDPDQLRASRPDIVIIMPWNIRDEVVEALSYIGEWGGQFAIFIPQLELLSPATDARAESVKE